MKETVNESILDPMRNQGKNLVINRTWCKGCGICAAFCPKQVLELDGDGKITAPRIGDCIYCRMCEMRCPDFAIEVTEESGHE